MARPHKLTEEQKVEILHRIEGGEREADIAPEYGVHQQTIFRIKWQAHGRARDDLNERVAKERKPREERPESIEDRADRFSQPTVTDPVSGATIPAESDATICKHVTRDLYRAFRQAAVEQDYKAQTEIAKAIAGLVRARYQIAPPKPGKSGGKLYTVEASPDAWPDPPKVTA